MTKFRIAGISFDHMHMGDLLRMVHDHPDAEIAGLYDPDPARMAAAVETFGVPADRVHTDLDACMAAAKPDLAILCSAPADHAAMTERLAAHGAHLFVEKPFASSADDARRMIAAMERAGRQMAINWPLAWVESHRTAKRLIDPSQRSRRTKSSAAPASIVRPSWRRIAPSPDRLPVTCPPFLPVAPSPIRSASSNTTSTPRSASSSAVATPVNPPPTIATSARASSSSAGRAGTSPTLARYHAVARAPSTNRVTAARAPRASRRVPPRARTRPPRAA